MIVSHFFTDQLETEMKTEERVKKGEISADEADKLNEDWEEVSSYYLCYHCWSMTRLDGRVERPLLKSDTSVLGA